VEEGIIPPYKKTRSRSSICCSNEHFQVFNDTVSQTLLLWEISERNNLKKEIFILVHGFRGLIPWFG
jgi:hypothetical protein